MASRYIRLSCYGSNADPRDDDDEISAAVALSLVPRKRKWGGSDTEYINMTELGQTKD